MSRLVELLKKARNDWLQKKREGETSKDLDEYVASYLLANGMLVPPCKEGDVIFGIFYSPSKGKKQVFEYDVEEVTYSSDRGVRPWIVICFGGRYFDNCDFGNTVFRTRAEAEKALAERGE